MGEFQPLLSPPPISKDELRHVMMISLPLVLLQFLEYITIPIINMGIGHLPLSEKESRIALSAGGLSNLFFTTTSYSLIIGVGTAMDALCSQSYGQGRASEIGIALQTAMLCAMVLCVPLALLSFFAGSIFILFGHPPEIAHATEQVTRWLILAIPFVFGYEFFKRVLQGQNIVWPIVGSVALGVVVDLVAAYFFMFQTTMGFTGGAIGMLAYYATAGFAMYQMIDRKRLHFDWDIAFSRLGGFLCLSLNGWIMFLSEFCGIAGTSFMAGSLPNASTALSANTIYSGFRSIVGMAFLGIGVASSIRVGNALGGNLPIRAKAAAWQTIAISSSWAVFTTVLMIFFGPIYATLYTDDPQVLEEAKSLFYVTAPFQVALGIWGAVQGTFRGSGNPHQGAGANVIAFCVIGMPLGHILSNSLGIVGLWVGISIGFSLCAIYGLYWMYHADWEDMAEKVSKHF